MSNNTVSFPTTLADFRDALHRGIASVTGNAIKKSHVLDKAICAALQVDNIDRLTALTNALEAASTPVETYLIEFDYEGNQQLIINGVRIDTALTHEEIVQYSVYDRAERLKELVMYKNEALRRGESVNMLMQIDIDTLMNSNAEWVLGVWAGAGFLCPDTHPTEFNQACEEMIQQAKDHYIERIGKLGKTGAILTNVTSYYSGDDIDGLYEGELVLLNRNCLGDDNLPVGMAMTPYKGEVPDDHIAAYIVNDNLVPVEFD